MLQEMLHELDEARREARWDSDEEDFYDVWD